MKTAAQRGSIICEQNGTLPKNKIKNTNEWKVPSK